MATIPFIEARFFDPSESRFELENRLRRHLRMLRVKKLPPSVLMPPEDALDDIDSFDPHLTGIIGVTSDEDARIKRRVKRLQELRKAASCLICQSARKTDPLSASNIAPPCSVCAGA